MPSLLLQSFPSIRSKSDARGYYGGAAAPRRKPLAVLSTTAPKSTATCTISLAHAMPSSAPIDDAVIYKLHETNVIPFPTSAPSPTSPTSGRPLPVPPKPHALLRSSPRSRKASLSPKPARIAPPMQRRTSRDPNVADNLVVELEDDGDSTPPPRPASPTPQAHLQRQHAGSPEPPAYSTLPPPYSVSDYEEKKDAEGPVVSVDVIDASKSPVVVAPVPVRPPRATAPSSSSSSKQQPSNYSTRRARISGSELKVLVYLYRTVVYGLEMRHRASLSAASSSSSLASDTRPHKPLGPRSTPHLKPTVLSPRAVPPPEEKSRFENALARAAAVSGVSRFPLVEEDEFDTVLDEDAVDGSSSNTSKTPYPSPSQSPRPISAFASLAGARSQSAPPTRKGKSKIEVLAELDVQDALLAIRLKTFLRAQGVPEGDLEIDMGVEFDPASPTREQVVVEEEVEVEEDDILEGYFSGMDDVEVEEKKRDGPLVEDDVDADVDEMVLDVKRQGPLVEDDDDSIPAVPPPTPKTVSQPLPPTQPQTPLQRLSSPPPKSPSPRPKAVLEPSYMVALLTMRSRYSSSPTRRKERDGARKSGLRVCVERD